MAISFDASSIAFSSASVSPVVPITMLMPSWRQYFRFCMVHSGDVKSIKTSQPFMAVNDDSIGMPFMLPLPSIVPAFSSKADISKNPSMMAKATILFPIRPWQPAMAKLFIIKPFSYDASP